MMRYLLAAEVDQIQDFIFQATHLREVVGGSQILTRFGKREYGAPTVLGITENDLVVSGGGSFRVLFSDLDAASRFGEQLAEVYHRATNGSLTVIDDPEPVDEEDDEDFRRASRIAQEKLRKAKRQGCGGLATAHFPYVAFCASCGVGLATEHRKRHDREDREEYLCDACLAKGAERAEESLGEFLEPFVQAVVGQGQNVQAYIWPGKDRPGAGKDLDPTADVGAYDPRRYVGYLIADGNDMGRVFNHCNKDQMRRLSEGLTATLQASLAEAARELKKRQPEIDLDFVPVLPLILGGDDLFVLLPAPWALDFTRCFCLQFEEQMTSLVNRLELPRRTDLPERMTIGASIVVCKANYPFYLAYAIGAERLDRAKQLAKRLACAEHGQMRSVVDLEVILGSQASAKPGEGTYRATLRPYWVGSEPVPEGWGVALDALLEQRLALRTLPRKRLSQLRALYYPSALPEEGDSKTLNRWDAQRKALFRRIEREQEMLKRVQAAFTALGGKDGPASKQSALDYWYASQRAADDDWYGHGLPDLLEAWDFAYQLDKPRRDYEEV